MKSLSKLFSVTLLAVPVAAAAQPGAQPAQPSQPQQQPPQPVLPGPFPTPVGPTPNPPLPAPLPEPEKPDPVLDPALPTGPDTLTLDAAIDIAMRQQPSLRQSKAQVEVALGHADQARVIERPTLSAAGTLGAASAFSTGTTMIVNGMPVRVGNPGPDFFSHTESTGLSASASWRIYDFGQTAANVRAADLNADASVAQVGITTLDIKTNVEVAYLTAVADKKLVLVAQNTVQSEAGHLDQAKRFVAAQAQDPIQVAQAQARYANAKSALAQAQSNDAIALANLRSAIGWVDPSRSPTVGASWPVPPNSEPAPLPALVEIARKNRPEIVQADKQLEASDASLTAAHAERRPVLSATASTQWAPASGNWDPQPSWQAGLALSVPLFDGGKASADIRVAAANVEVAAAARDALLITLTSQLDSARSQIVANRENVTASREAVAAARSQLQLSEARYTQGLGSQIELADAQTAVTTAEGNLVQAEFQLATAWAQLHRATAGM